MRLIFTGLIRMSILVVAVDPYNFDVLVTNEQGDLISYVGGAESVYGSNFNDLIVGDDAKIFYKVVQVMIR